MRRTSEPLTGIVNSVCGLSGEGDDGRVMVGSGERTVALYSAAERTYGASLTSLCRHDPPGPCA